MGTAVGEKERYFKIVTSTAWFDENNWSEHF